jgi:peptidoglycan hydrolase-like protein with peptidoglycan-binding domain
MIRFFAVLATILSLCWGQTSTAQTSGDKVWVQIEAQPDAPGATDRARAYAAIFPDVAGYQLNTNWYGIVLGPYSPAEGAGRLNTLLRENMIPADSYIVDGTAFRTQFWPTAGARQVAPVTDVPVIGEPQATQEPVVAPEIVDIAPVIIEETKQDARRAEAELLPEDRQLLQTALQWYGFYNSVIDGDFGPGTRNSMAKWQAAKGFEETGVLTTKQRASLVADYQSEVATFGFAPVDEAQSGIGITLPLNLVEFDHYEPPFVHFREKAGSDVQIILISQPGDQAAFYGLYDVLQTLTVVPVTGERSRGERSFSIVGTSPTVQNTTYAELKSGLIKGYMLITKPGNPDRDARILAAMQSSFASTSDRALDPGMVAMGDAAREGLLSGLSVRKPAFSRSGVFIDATGTVLTTIEAVANCERITLERDKDATLRLTDSDLGIAVLTPVLPMAPPAVAAFQASSDRLGSEVAVSGYSYEDRLSAPVLTFGTLQDSKGLNGEPLVKRLGLSALPGDAGGPVLDGSGELLGLLQPRSTDKTRILPDDVAYATSAAPILARLARDGIAVQTAIPQGALAPEDLARLARDMTVLVSCWK